MTEQTTAPENEQPPPLPGADPTPNEEDAGRLTTASRGRLIAILVMLVLITEIVSLQYTMVTIILPKLAQAFPVSGNSTSWAVTIVGVVGGATLAIFGKAGDLYGKKRVMVLSGLIFLVGALICATTSSWALFLLGRGISATTFGLNAVNYGIVRDIMPRRWIPVCVGVLGAGLGMNAIIAPLVGGALVDHFSWRSIFWFQLICMIIVIPLFALVVPESPVRVRQRFDLLGGLLLGGGVASTLVYLSEGSAWRWTDLGCLGYLFAGVAALVGFVLWERRTPHPMLELSLLRSPKLSLLFLTSFLITGVQALVNVIQSYLFQTPKASDLNHSILEGVAAKTHTPVSTLSQVVHFRGDVSYAAGYSVLQLAVHISMWVAIFSMILSPIGGYLARRVGARVPLVIATVAMLASSALFINWHSTWQEQVSIGFLLAIGMGFFFAAWPNLIIDNVPVDRQGVSAGMFNVFGAVGTSVPIALMASILAAHPYQMVMPTPGGGQIVTDIPQVSTDDAFSQTYLLLCVIPCAIAVVIALAMRSGRTPARGGAPA